MFHRWGAVLLVLAASAAQAQDFQFIEPLGRTVSPTFDRTRPEPDAAQEPEPEPEPEQDQEPGVLLDKVIPTSRVIRRESKVKPFAAATYADSDGASFMAATLGARWLDAHKKTHQIDALLGRIDPVGPGDNLDRWRVRYGRSVATVFDVIDIGGIVSFQDAKDTAKQTEAGVTAEHEFKKDWYVTANLGWSSRNPDTGGTKDDFLATVGLTRVMNRWVVSTDYALENKLNGDDSFTLGVELDERLVLLVDDDETVILTFKHMFSTGKASP